MLLSRCFGRQDVRMTRRFLSGRRLLVEALEDRRLPSAVTLSVGKWFYSGTEAIQGNHIGTAVVDATTLPSGGVARKH